MTECVIVDNQVETCDPPRAFMESVSARPLTLAVGVATTGRRDILSAVLPLLTEQSRLPDRLVVSIADPSDVDRSVVTALPFPTEILSGPKGLCAQRNRILEQVADADLLVFLDDDYLLDPTYLAEAEKLFSSQVDVVVATGCVLADGIHGRGMEVSEGRRRLLEGAQPKTDNLADIYGAYGCNMLVRLAPVRENAITFDEALPLYGWLEDIDFSRRVAPFGRVVRCSRLQGVHLGTKRGRAAGLKLG